MFGKGRAGGGASMFRAKALQSEKTGVGKRRERRVGNISTIKENSNRGGKTMRAARPRGAR